MKTIRIDSSLARVSSLLKKYVNSKCEGDIDWFREVGDMPELTDILYVISILDEYKPKPKTKELPVAVEDLCFTVKTYNKLTTNGITTTSELCGMSVGDLQKLRGVGAGMINEIITVLSVYGVELRRE